MSPKKVIIPIVILAVIAVVVGFAVTSGFDKKGPDGQYNYDVTFSDTFTSLEGTTVEAPIGRTFALVDITVQNDNFSEGVSTSTLVMVWRFTIDRMTYDENTVRTMAHPDYWNVVIEKGKCWRYTVVFEIDENAVVKRDINLTYKYVAITGGTPSLVYNKDLVSN